MSRPTAPSRGLARRVSVVLTFDLDAETIWTSRNKDFARLPVLLSQGTYGPRTAVPRILHLLRERELRATFFVPGAVVQMHESVVRSIHEAGHEIANHGYYHEWPERIRNRKEEMKILSRANAEIARVTGSRPVGYRSPAWEFSPHTASILSELGFLYSSNMMDCDSVHWLGSAMNRLVELPVSWILDDAAFWLYSLRLPAKTIQPLHSVYEYWTEEFQGLYDDTTTTDKCFVLTMHPQIIGRSSRIRLLERFIDYVQGHKGVTFFTGAELARDFAGKAAADL